MKLKVLLSTVKSMKHILNSCWILVSFSIAYFITAHISSIVSISVFWATLIQSSNFLYIVIAYCLLSFSLKKVQLRICTSRKRKIDFSTFIASFISLIYGDSSTSLTSSTSFVAFLAGGALPPFLSPATAYT
jgi:hypothetical protein